MLQIDSLIFLLVIIGLVWLWSESRRAAETASAVCQRTCRDLEVQLLDQAVALCGLGVSRDRNGRLGLMRQFRFEFSTSGADRLNGRVTMLGSRVESIVLDQPDGSTHVAQLAD